MEQYLRSCSRTSFWLKCTSIPISSVVQSPSRLVK
uniref:Uncharacterized protein n=1 Tax=Arundo donax TaxID=35708 RepID=A0A0A9ECF9_ARUDO